MIQTLVRNGKVYQYERSMDSVDKDTRRSRAQQRALRLLKERHRAEYEAIYAECKRAEDLP